MAVFIGLYIEKNLFIKKLIFPELERMQDPVFL